MKFKIYEEKETTSKYFLALRHDLTGGPTLMFVDENGERVPRSSLVYFDREGSFHLCSNINEEIGLDLDKDGRIKVKNQ